MPNAKSISNTATLTKAPKRKSKSSHRNLDVQCFNPGDTWTLPPATEDCDQNTQLDASSDKSAEAVLNHADPLAVFRTLSQRAQAGDHAAIDELRALMVNQPKLIELFGDVGRHARQGWCNFFAGGDIGIGEAMMVKSDQVSNLFAGPGATPIERLLAEQIATAWLRLSALSLNETVDLKSWDKPAGDYLLKRHDLAMRQFYESIRQLEEYRWMIGRAGIRPN